jgi:hypothetical protein
MPLLVQNMKHEEKSLMDFASPSNDQFDSQKSDLEIVATKYELKNGIIRMATEKPFSGMKDENPYRHIEKFARLCNTVKLEGVPLAWFRCNLFPFSLVGEAERWYAHASFDVKGNWEEFMKAFCPKNFPMGRIIQLRKQIINFAQEEDEGIDQAWEQFNELVEQGPNLGFIRTKMEELLYL